MKNIFISKGPEKKVYILVKGPTKWLRHLGGYNGKKGGAPTVTQKTTRCSEIDAVEYIAWVEIVRKLGYL